eukprot:1139554-Pelagomonas_calceolata.AAC.1
MYANMLVTTRRAIENKNTSCSRVMEPASWWRGLMALLSQCVSFSLNDVGRISSAYAAKCSAHAQFHDEDPDAHESLQMGLILLYVSVLLQPYRQAMIGMEEDGGA